MIFDKSHLGRIRIIGISDGDAPLEIRKLWIGVEMPCLYFEEANKSSVGIVTRQIRPVHSSYTVLQSHAIEALAKVSPPAAHYWNEIGYPRGTLDLFTFSADSVQALTKIKTREEFFGDYLME